MISLNSLVCSCRNIICAIFWFCLAASKRKARRCNTTGLYVLCVVCECACKSYVNSVQANKGSCVCTCAVVVIKLQIYAVTFSALGVCTCIRTQTERAALSAARHREMGSTAYVNTCPAHANLYVVLSHYRARGRGAMHPFGFTIMFGVIMRVFGAGYETD